MKILIANKFFFPNGGSEAVMFQERDFLLRSGHEVVDFSMQNARNLVSPFAQDFVSARLYAGQGGPVLSRLQSAVTLLHSWEAVRKIGALIDRERPDIVHCHNVYHQLTPSIIGAAKARSVPVVLTLHDFKSVCPTYLRLRDGHVCSECVAGDFWNVVRLRCAGGAVGRSALLYAEAVIQRALGSYEKVDLFLAPSRFMMESVTMHRFSKERVQLLYNGTDTDAFRGTGRDDGYVLYLGRLSAEKGIRTLLGAHAAMHGVRLVVAGTGPDQEELRGRYSQAEFIGHVTGERLRETIDGAAVIVVPSEWYENCPMSLLEAMAYGKPVVASRIGGIPELVSDGETGLMFEAGDSDGMRRALVRLCEDKDLRLQLGKAARLRAETEFSLVRHNKQLLEIYESMLRKV